MVPADTNGPATWPPTTCPCGPARVRANGPFPAARPPPGGIMVAEIDRMSKRPWDGTVAVGVRWLSKVLEHGMESQEHIWFLFPLHFCCMYDTVEFRVFIDKSNGGL